MRTSELVPVTFLVHPLIVATVKPLIEKLIRPDNEGEQYRALAAPWIDCRLPPAHSYQGDIFRLDMIGPVTGEGADRSYSEAYLIPSLTDHHPCAQRRRPMVMMRQGCSARRFQAKQHWSRMSA